MRGLFRFLAISALPIAAMAQTTGASQATAGNNSPTVANSGTIGGNLNINSPSITIVYSAALRYAGDHPAGNAISAQRTSSAAVALEFVATAAEQAEKLAEVWEAVGKDINTGVLHPKTLKEIQEKYSFSVNSQLVPFSTLGAFYKYLGEFNNVWRSLDCRDAQFHKDDTGCAGGLTGNIDPLYDRKICIC